MNPFVVDWSVEAMDGLAAAWMAATDKPAVNQAQSAIDSLLSQSPFSHGTPVSEGLFGLNIPPLRVVYSVDGNTNRVEISSANLLA
jgi:hypothetical protein